MKTGIFGRKGHVHFAAAPCLDEWLGTLDASSDKAEVFALVARRIDHEIHRSYRLYPNNYIAADLLQGNRSHAEHYDEAAERTFNDYLAQRLAMAAKGLTDRGLRPDEDFLRERILTMYANPLFNHEKATKRDEK